MKEAYVWGNTVNGELGLGGIEEEFVSETVEWTELSN